MIPDHLRTLTGYPGHLAWLRVRGISTTHDPGDAPPVRLDPRYANLRSANLRDADLHGADLHGAVLSGANLRDAVLSDADLHGADLRDAVLRGADLRDAVLSDAVLSGAVLSGANLRDAVLSGAVLSGANLRDAVLSDADLHGAVLSGAIGICSAGPVGRERRIIYAVRHESGPMVQAGCWWGTLADTEERIAEHYAGSPWLDPYLAAVRAAAACVMVDA